MNLNCINTSFTIKTFFLVNGENMKNISTFFGYFYYGMNKNFALCFIAYEREVYRKCVKFELETLLSRAKNKESFPSMMCLHA